MSEEKLTDQAKNTGDLAVSGVKPEPKKPVTVVATAIGYFDGKVREVSDEFEVPFGSTATWFCPAKR